MNSAPEPARRVAPALTLAGLAAALASTCCVLPLLLALAGVTGAWIGRLHVLRPYSGALLVLAGVALAVAAWRLYWPAPGAACAAEDMACRQGGRTARRWFWLVLLLTLVPLLLPLLAPLFY